MMTRKAVPNEPRAQRGTKRVRQSEVCGIETSTHMRRNGFPVVEYMVDELAPVVAIDRFIIVLVVQPCAIVIPDAESRKAGASHDLELFLMEFQDALIPVEPRVGSAVMHISAIQVWRILSSEQLFSRLGLTHRPRPRDELKSAELVVSNFPAANLRTDDPCSIRVSGVSFQPTEDGHKVSAVLHFVREGGRRGRELIRQAMREDTIERVDVPLWQATEVRRIVLHMAPELRFCARRCE